MLADQTAAVYDLRGRLQVGDEGGSNECGRSVAHCVCRCCCALSGCAFWTHGGDVAAAQATEGRAAEAAAATGDAERRLREAKEEMGELMERAERRRETERQLRGELEEVKGG